MVRFPPLLTLTTDPGRPPAFHVSLSTAATRLVRSYRSGGPRQYKYVASGVVRSIVHL